MTAPFRSKLSWLNFRTARYNEWSPDERGVFLCDSLTGPASQILWEVSDDVDHNEIIRLLRNRFGSLNQMERYRAELKGRKRKRGETAQSVYQDIKRLMALAFPSRSGEMYEIIARDAFLDSLSDPALRVRVLDQFPKTLDEALTTVLRMEAYSEITSGADENNGDDRRKHVRYVSASTAKNSDLARLIKIAKLIDCGQRPITQIARAFSLSRQRTCPRCRLARAG